MTIARKALVTGASGSVGSAIARQLLGAGYAVTIQGRRQNDLVVPLIGAGAVWWECDLAADTFEQKWLASCDILVNAAGVLLSKGPVHLASADEYERTMAVNVRAPFTLCQKVIPGMIDRSWGRIVNVGSIYSLRATSNNSVYNMSKHALSGLTGTIAKDYASHGITCNEVCPAAVDSRLIRRIATQWAETHGGTSNDYLANVAAAIPAGRMPTPDEVAAVVSFLVSEPAGMINGVSIPVDGGLIC